METEDCSEHDQAYQHDYDDEHDSDVEARLYAEVYYSKTIIGEENNTNNSAPEYQCSEKVNDFVKRNANNDDLLLDKNVTHDKSNRNITCDNNSSIVILNNSTNNASTTIENSTKESNTGSTNNFSKDSGSTHGINNVSKISNSKKRKSNNCLDEGSKSSKRKKHENQNSVRESQSSRVNGPSAELQLNQEKTHRNDGSALINPYNKNIKDNAQQGVELLSPEFIDIFFTGKSRKKKKKDDPVRIDKRKSVSESLPSTDIAQQSSNMQLVNNNLENDFSTNSTIIDISSESSNESFEDDSKYNTIVATDKKLRERQSGLKNADTNGASDSEESIFEVPVPPKPAPPVIEVKDSDNECENQSDEDSLLNDSFISQETEVQNDHEVTLDSTLNETQDICEIISDSDDSNGLILNCTGVQRGVSSLNEIKKLNQQILTPNPRNSNTTNSSNTQHSQNKSESSTNPAVNEKSSTSLKSKQKSKNLSPAEYFFQPMNEKMKSFYNDSWGGENFDMDQIKSKMTTDPNKWAILNKDLTITGPRKKRYFGMTCARCHKDGHRQNDCPEPNKGPTCYMCGTSGHYATYCPHTKCLTCGRQQTMYRTTCGFCEKLFCTRCRSQGHRDDSCPDLWRRYHHTTNSLAPKVPLNVKNVMKSRHELFCCNCTKQGHDSMACKRLRWSQHFPNPPFVTHYSGPSYSPTRNIEAQLIVDVTQENPYRKHNNSSTPTTAPTNFPRSDRRNENSIQSGIDRSSTGLDSNKKIIFDVCRMKAKFNDEAQSKKNLIKSVTLKLSVPDKNNPGAVEKWKKLTDFLKGLGYDLSSEFRLEHKDKQLLLYMKSSRKYIESLSTLIKQYANRSVLERTQMLLSGERTMKVIVENLSRKFAEMQNLSEDISTLYEETRRMRKELLDNENRIKNEIQNRIKLNELVVSQKKLLMLLYREGFGDESLGQLRKIFLKMQKSIERCPDKRLLKKNSKYVPVIPKLSFKQLFTYLYYYNNVFVPHESKNLDSYIIKYRDNLDKRNKLLNSELLFPQETIEKHNDSNENPVQDSEKTLAEDLYEKPVEDSEKTLAEDLSETPVEDSEKTLAEDLSEPSASTSQESSILENTVTETSVDSIGNISIDTELSNKRLVPPEKKTERKLNHLYLQAMQAQNQNRKSYLMQNFQNFVKNARNALEKASKLNSPRLLDDIVALQRELEDETYLSTNKVRKFKLKLREERLKLLNQPVNKKNTKKPKKARLKPKKGQCNNNAADNIYKKFCASL